MPLFRALSRRISTFAMLKGWCCCRTLKPLSTFSRDERDDKDICFKHASLITLNAVCRYFDFLSDRYIYAAAIIIILLSFMVALY